MDYTVPAIHLSALPSDMWETICAASQLTWRSQVSSCGVASLWPSGFVSDPSLLCLLPQCGSHMQQSSVESEPDRPWLSRLGTEHQRESSMWFLRCHTSLTLGIFLGMNNSHAGNPAFLLPLPVCDERLYHGQTLIDHDKMNHCSSRPEKKFRG